MTPDLLNHVSLLEVGERRGDPLAWGLADDLASVFQDVILADATVLKLPFGLRGSSGGFT